MGAAVTFKASDLARAVKTMRDVGLTIAGAEITREGTIRVLTANDAGEIALTPAPAEPESGDLSPLERWERRRGHGAA